MVLVCEFCQEKSSSKYNLKRHQETNSKCLALRNKEKPSLHCEYCEKDFKHLSIHQKSCKAKSYHDFYQTKIDNLHLKLKEKSLKNKKLNRENEKLKRVNEQLNEQLDSSKDKIVNLEGIVTGLKTAPDKRTIYNTAIHPKLVDLPINNIPALTDEYVIEKVNEGILTYEKATKGYRGMLDIICELITHENDDGITERNYVCTDVSRNSFHRLLKSKKWKSDKGGRYLNNMINTFQDVMEDHKNKAYEIYNKTPHDSFDWEQVDWERKNVALLYSGIVCNEGTGDREELVNVLRKEISKRASV
jgi:hypothetical protein